jgi:cellulose synthase/poly-beta-1,6-N-acetylglucosamine synthase-like glycosyltransferase
MINIVCAFDYPKECLFIQVLDDSTDQTTEIAAQRVAFFKEQGFNIELFHRTQRVGYKAGALAEAMQRTHTEYVAIFDADFTPPVNFLKRVIPHFALNPRIGMVQTRWGHANRESNTLTRTQALFLDGHQVVEQVARSRSNLFLNFNGSGGIWRCECIEDAGGWQWDTLAEDIDLSYRAQIKGWKLMFLPDLIVPAEIPLTMPVFKTQQYRWTFGHIQVFRKLIGKVWSAPHLTLAQRLGGTFHLSTNFMQLAALASFLLTLPMTILHPKQPSALGLISMASCGPTVLFAISQICGYKDGFKRAVERLIHLPVLVLLAIGMTISNCGAVLSALARGKMTWTVTPKASNALQKKMGAGMTAVPVSVWLEIATSIYCTVALSIAYRHAHDLIPVATLGMLSFAYVGGSCLVDSQQPPKKARNTKVEMAQQ